MTTDPRKQVLRLRKKHTPGGHAPPTVEDGMRLVRAQSLSQALFAGTFVIVAFAVCWSMLSVALARVFPWLTILLGYLVGLAVRRGGQGLDWRFPLLAATLALVGSIGGNIVVAAALTGEALGTGTFMILRRTTTMTWPVFFDEVMTVADLVYALAASGIAAFLANRRLSRRQYQALRLWQRQQHQRTTQDG